MRSCREQYRVATRMRFQRLEDWLAWQEGLHPKAIDLGLERVHKVWQCLGAPKLAPVVISVTGTNGKGSVVAYLRTILEQAGYRVGSYTSPHLFHYTERIRVCGEPITSDLLCSLFAEVDTARGEGSLTYFEFGTLAALLAFARNALDVVILEVGLGGRLDAINIIDADLVLLTRVALDHVEWLGNTRDAIGREKAGLFRAERFAVCGSSDIPESVFATAQQLGTRLGILGTHYSYSHQDSVWDFKSLASPCQGSRFALPYPALRGKFQLENAALALAGLSTLAEILPVSQQAVRAGLQAAVLPGRFEIFTGPPDWIFDVCHNPDAVFAFAETLRMHRCTGLTHAIFGVMADKNLAGILEIMRPVVDSWHLPQLQAERAQTPFIIAEQLGAPKLHVEVHLYETVEDAVRGVNTHLQPAGRVLVFGSFVTVAKVQQIKYNSNSITDP